jgi:glycosyltransferase involved in cell wall biosynthesis
MMRDRMVTGSPDAVAAARDARGMRAGWSPGLDPRRILTLTPFLWSGAGKAIVRLQLELRARGFECDVVSTGSCRGLADWPEYVEELRRAGVGYAVVNLFDRDAAELRRSVGAVGRLIRARRPDLLHAHSGVAAYVAAGARSGLEPSIPLVTTFHSWNPSRPEWMNHADVAALARSDRVVTVSRSYRRTLRQWGLDLGSCETIRLGVDLPARETRPGGARTFTILTLARIEPRKDLETALRGFAQFRRRVPASELLVAGPVADVGYFERLCARAARFRWTDGVRFLGKVEAPEVWYRRADAYVTASRDEGLGLSLLEAMSWGLPAVATPVAGHRDFVRSGGNALTFAPGDAAGLARALLALHVDPARARRLGAAARRTVERSYSWSSTVERYLALYGRLWDARLLRRAS